MQIYTGQFYVNNKTCVLESQILFLEPWACFCQIPKDFALFFFSSISSFLGCTTVYAQTFLGAQKMYSKICNFLRICYIAHLNELFNS